MSIASLAVAAAKAQVGKPYKWGSAGPNSFDCSGLMTYAYQQAGLSGFSRWTTSALMAGTKLTQKVSLSDVQPGDMLLFGNPVNHVGMAIGGGQMVSAPYTGATVKIGGIGSPVAAVRVVGAGGVVSSVVGAATAGVKSILLLAVLGVASYYGYRNKDRILGALRARGLRLPNPGKPPTRGQLVDLDETRDRYLLEDLGVREHDHDYALWREAAEQTRPRPRKRPRKRK
ncbi:MAG: NlpC/P60 family protein [Pseudomonadota bacterium]|nr:NlpC/P60 family protein [Pseudomonadota bacterium]